MKHAIGAGRTEQGTARRARCSFGFSSLRGFKDAAALSVSCCCSSIFSCSRSIFSSSSLMKSIASPNIDGRAPAPKSCFFGPL